jgi:hypothetical protein
VSASTFPAEPLVLGIETSCDETGIGIVRGRTLLSNTIASSMDEHSRYGGVVPEVAARAHLEALQPAIEAALTESGVALADLDAVAVTSGRFYVYPITWSSVAIRMSCTTSCSTAEGIGPCSRTTSASGSLRPG